MDAFAFNNDHICSWDNFAEMAQECKQYKSVDFQHEWQRGSSLSYISNIMNFDDQ